VRGGAVYADSGSQTNSVFGDNQASDTGSAIYISTAGAMLVRHVTVAGSSSLSGTGITIGSGTVRFTNTIVSQYNIGIQRLAGTTSQDYNLFFGNTVAVAGGVTGGAHSVNADPKFVNPAANDYHLGPGSAAESEGTDVGVTTDYDGDARPIGGAFDIGFDEARERLYLPAVVVQ
jgi:hypothetical protein